MLTGALLMLAMPAMGTERAAAKIEFVFGTADIVSVTGQKRAAEKGSPVYVGDTVTTLDARTQLRFTDGAYVALLPRSEFRVNAYRYDGQLDGNERLIMQLIRGGLRTISGQVGKGLQSAYEMITEAATIGIRGTDYTVVYGEGISGSVASGHIAVCNAGGCLDVPQGQSYYVHDQNTKPVFTGKAALLQPPQPNSVRKKSSGDKAEMGLAMRNLQRSKDGRSAADADQSHRNAGTKLIDKEAGNGGLDKGADQDISFLSDTTSLNGVGFTHISSAAPQAKGPASQAVIVLQNLGLGSVNGNGAAWGKGGKRN
ncbi:MAG: FecR domain-containing protein [Burkholderiales bacterium]